jgi:hypothetical protein
VHNLPSLSSCILSGIVAGLIAFRVPISCFLELRTLIAVIWSGHFLAIQSPPAPVPKMRPVVRNEYLGRA